MKCLSCESYKCAVTKDLHNKSYLQEWCFKGHWDVDSACESTSYKNCIDYQELKDAKDE